MNSYGHSLTSSLSLSAPEQQLDFSYKVPLLKSPLEQYYLMQGGFKRTDLNDTRRILPPRPCRAIGRCRAAGSAR